jgi:hypothetical protein
MEKCKATRQWVDTGKSKPQQSSNSPFWCCIGSTLPCPFLPFLTKIRRELKTTENDPRHALSQDNES